MTSHPVARPDEEPSADALADACDVLIEATTSLLVDLEYAAGSAGTARSIALEEAEMTIRRVATIARSLRKVAPKGMRDSR